MWDLPGPAEWRRELLALADQGVSCICIVPSREIPQGVTAAFDGGVYQIDLSGSEPLSRLRLAKKFVDQLGLNVQDTSDISAVAQAPELRHEVMLLDARDLEPESVEAVLQFTRSFADAARPLDRADRPAIVTLAAAGAILDIRLPISDVACEQRWWWGVLSPIDSHVYAQRAGVPDPLIDAVVEVCRWDLQLIEQFSSWNGSFRSIVDFLPAAREPIESTVLHRHVAGTRPGTGLFVPWIQGEVESWKGLVSHSIANDLWANPDSWKDRVWLGQLGSTFSLIEVERSRLSIELDSKLRGRARQEGWGDTDLLQLEIGPLKKCFSDHRHMFKVSQTRHELLKALTKTRNDLAHRRPIESSVMRDLRALVDRDHEFSIERS